MNAVTFYQSCSVFRVSVSDVYKILVVYFNVTILQSNVMKVK